MSIARRSGAGSKRAKLKLRRGLLRDLGEAFMLARGAVVRDDARRARLMTLFREVRDLLRFAAGAAGQVAAATRLLAQLNARYDAQEVRIATLERIMGVTPAPQDAAVDLSGGPGAPYAADEEEE